MFKNGWNCLNDRKVQIQMPTNYNNIKSFEILLKLFNGKIQWNVVNMRTKKQTEKHLLQRID